MFSKYKEFWSNSHFCVTFCKDYIKGVSKCGHVRYFPRHRYDLKLKLMLFFCLYLLFIDFTCQSKQTFSRVVSLKLKIQQYNHISAIFQITWRTLKPARETKAVHGQWSVECVLTIRTRLLTPLQCRHNIFTPPFPLCSVWQMPTQG